MGKNWTPICLGDTANLQNEEWLKWRNHGPNYMNDANNPIPYIPYTLGGSDMAVVMNCSPFNNALNLYGVKAGKIERTAPTNAGQLEMGHLMEPVLAEWFAKETGATIINDTNMYQHPHHKWAIADMDRRFILPDGRKGILEIKTTNYRSGPDKWKDNSYPEYYEKQLRYYMGVDDCDLGCFICCWGFNPDNDIAIRWVERDFAKEEEIFKAGEYFINCLENQTPPKYVPSVNPTDALAAINAIYGSITDEKDMELPESMLDTVMAVQQMQEEHAALSAEAKELKEKIDIKKCYIVEAMKGYSGAFCVDKDGNRIYLVKNTVTKPRETIEKNKLISEYPQVDLKLVIKVSAPSSKLTVKVKTVTV